MSVFTRNDKADSNSTTAAAAPPRDIVEPLKPVAEVRPQAVAQPMASPSVSTPRSHGVSVISKALKITGQLESTEDIQIDGEVDGDVRGVNVKVGSNAKVKGTVYGEEVELAGTVDGKIEAKKVVILGTGHMAGDVVHQDIQIASGAHVEGHLKPEFGKTAKIVRAAE